MRFTTIRTLPYNIFADVPLVGERLRLCVSLLRKEFVFGNDERDFIFSSGTIRTKIAGKSLKDLDQYFWIYGYAKDRPVKKLKITIRGRGFSIPICSRPCS